MIVDERQKAMFESFFSCKKTNRCLVNITLKNENIQSAYLSNEDRWLNIEKRLDNFEREVATTQYIAESLPIFFNDFGPGAVAEYLGGSFEPEKNTVWFGKNKNFNDYADSDKLKFNNNSLLFSKTKEVIKQCQKREIFTALTDLGGTLDIASSLLGIENLLMDMLVEPEQLKKLIAIIDDAWIKSFNEFVAVTKTAQNGFSSWLTLYSEKPFYPLQCDVSVNISNDMFDEFALPSLQKQASLMDNVIYHLDGDGEIKHLESILKIKNLKAIECVPLPSSDGGLDVLNPKWIETYKKIQSKGKSLIIREVTTKKLEPLIKEISQTGLYLGLIGVKTIQEANDILQFLEKNNK